ncbi:MAG: arginase family protein [Bacteroidales bacterium]
MNLNDYFDPIAIGNTDRNYIKSDKQLLSSVCLHTIENKISVIEDFHIAIIGVTYTNEDTIDAVSKIRNNLYSLALPEKKIRICDLGNIKYGKTKQDSESGLRDVIVELLSLNITPIVLGLAENIIYPVFAANNKLGKKVNIVSVDNKINISEDRDKSIKSSFWRILVEENDALFSFTNIGYQSHFTGSNTIKFLSDSLNNVYRLGSVRSNIQEVEPYLRDADFTGINISSVRQADAPGREYPSPNGFYGEEICQIARYAGMSNKQSAFGVFDYFSLKDNNDQTAQLAAQVIWYFIDGLNHKILEHPNDKGGEYKKFIVNLNSFESELIFYKSEKTQRWWMQVPSFNQSKVKNLLISCTYYDYQLASKGDVPEKWLKAYQKIN